MSETQTTVVRFVTWKYFWCKLAVVQGPGLSFWLGRSGLYGGSRGRMSSAFFHFFHLLTLYSKYLLDQAVVQDSLAPGRHQASTTHALTFQTNQKLKISKKTFFHLNFFSEKLLEFKREFRKWQLKKFLRKMKGTKTGLKMLKKVNNLLSVNSFFNAVSVEFTLEISSFSLRNCHFVGALTNFVYYESKILTKNYAFTSPSPLKIVLTS